MCVWVGQCCYLARGLVRARGQILSPAAVTRQIYLVRHISLSVTGYNHNFSDAIATLVSLLFGTEDTPFRTSAVGVPGDNRSNADSRGAPGAKLLCPSDPSGKDCFNKCVVICR